MNSLEDCVLIVCVPMSAPRVTDYISRIPNSYVFSTVNKCYNIYVYFVMVSCVHLAPVKVVDYCLVPGARRYQYSQLCVISRSWILSFRSKVRCVDKFALYPFLFTIPLMLFICRFLGPSLVVYWSVLCYMLMKIINLGCCRCHIPYFLTGKMLLAFWD